MSIWMQILPYQVSDILSKDPFDYKGIEWIKKLMYLFHKYPNIDQMNDHFMEIARIIAENFSLSREEIWQKVKYWFGIDEKRKNDISHLLCSRCV